MTVRDATRRESPDGNVLYVEELRRYLGVRTDAGESPSTTNATESCPEVLLIGHDMHGDFEKMEKDGINLPGYFHYLGCVDTHVIVEDTGAMMGKSLGALAYHYDLARPEWKGPMCPSIPPKLSFAGSHCAGNDAVVTLGSILGQALDLSLKTSGHEDSKDEGILPEDWLEKPLQGMNTNLILLAYDTEGVENPKYKPDVRNRTSEHGFAWVHVADIAHIPPGSHGVNWRPFFHAEHWINHDFRNFTNRYFCVGNPKGFWPRYGKSQYYCVSDGPAPFHRLFEKLAGDSVGAVEGPDVVGEGMRTFERTTPRENTPALRGNKANLEGETTKEVTDARGNQPARRGNANNTGGTPTNTRGKQPASRGNVIRAREITTRPRGNEPAFGGNTNSLRENTVTNKGNGRSWAQIARANTSKL